jgi:hypothetical protein
MNDFIVGAACVAIAVVVFGLGWIASASTIGGECKALGAFYVSNTVYECKLKEKNT